MCIRDSEKGYDIIVLNTICNATEERQTEAERIAKEVDAMIVIGGRASYNKPKLFEICKKECENTYYIQTIKDLDLTRLKSTDNVGITAVSYTHLLFAKIMFINHSLSIRFLIPASFSRFPVNSLFSLHK